MNLFSKVKLINIVISVIVIVEKKFSIVFDKNVIFIMFIVWLFKLLLVCLSSVSLLLWVWYVVSKGSVFNLLVNKLFRWVNVVKCLCCWVVVFLLISIMNSGIIGRVISKFRLIS